MSDTQLDLAGEAANAKAYSVSELAFALKRTVEDAYGYVRLRGEISKVTFHSNGHVYLDLKDDRACISGVIWRAQAAALGMRPQTGLEVIVTGKVTTYPARSQYQIIIETMAPAGVGALLAQLERLKAKLAEEGLFAPDRKRPLPAMPAVIGVITSPTGAVIRDILHRIADRWPCRVVVWPVVVQGEAAASQVRAAIEGFGRLDPAGPIPRPDLIIVARGGGSVEDLWPFNDEALARAASASPIPLVSAVGHETDTTLIDFVSDRRAPTPTAAAELVTPVFADLAGALADYQRRLIQCGAQAVDNRRNRLAAAARGLPRPVDLMAIATQSLDLAAGRLGAALQRNVDRHRHDFAASATALKPRLLAAAIDEKGRRVDQLARRLAPCATRRIEALAERLDGLDKRRLTLEPRAPLKRGFALVHRADGHLAYGAAVLAAGEGVELEFADGRRAAVIDGPPPFALEPSP
ncbi:MAG TPA: exodeoxyribonuclease VII large subunit [Caulobacteraceae bacterium]|jgi:exodeoxyribonuclease VII large subunit|nr:exodeoxyribonuclease VII large subunit [Caulobacteraceae bacterium]